MSETIKLQIKIDGNLKEVEMSADELAKAFVNVKDKVRELNEKLLNANQAAQLFDQVSSAVQGLQSAMHGLTDAYAVQSAAEARLEHSAYHQPFANSVRTRRPSAEPSRLGRY